jgi:hypothetical protein
MIAKWIVLATAVVAVTPLVGAAELNTPFDGVAATLLFDGSGGQPELIVTQGWSCNGPTLDGSDWVVSCQPNLGGRAVGIPLFCENAYANVGGTPVTFGHGTVKVSCANTNISASCTVDWVASGSCDASLPGSYPFPLVCKATNDLTIVGGGRGYSQCANGLGVS